MASLVDRMIAAAKLQPELYDEVERDPNAMGQAMTVVVIASVAAGIGNMGFAGPLGLIGGSIAALIGWLVWAVLIHFVGTALLAQPGQRVELGQVLRVIGFSAAPGVIRVVAFIPVLGGLISLAAWIWMLAAMVVAVRQVFRYQSTGRAVLVCIIGWFVQLLIVALFMMIGLGGAFMLAA